jgi:hypothetical protein
MIIIPNGIETRASQTSIIMIEARASQTSIIMIEARASITLESKN